MKRASFEIDNNISLDELYNDLIYYRGQGIYAYCIYNGRKIDNDLNNDELKRLIDMLKLNMNEEEYANHLEETKRIDYINQIIYKKISVNPLTRFWIDSVIRYLPDELKVSWEYDCYDNLLHNLMNENAIRGVSLLITSLFEEQNESELFKKLQLIFILLGNNRSLMEITILLKKYAPRQAFLEKYVYPYTESNIPRDYEQANELSKFYNFIYGSSDKGSTNSK